LKNTQPVVLLKKEPGAVFVGTNQFEELGGMALLALQFQPPQDRLHLHLLRPQGLEQAVPLVELLELACRPLLAVELQPQACALVLLIFNVVPQLPHHHLLPVAELPVVFLKLLTFDHVGQHLVQSFEFWLLEPLSQNPVKPLEVGSDFPLLLVGLVVSTLAAVLETERREPLKAVQTLD